MLDSKEYNRILRACPSWNAFDLSILGVGIFTLVGLAFLFIQDFHRPLLEIIQK